MWTLCTGLPRPSGLQVSILKTRLSPSPPAPPELTRHGEGGQEGRLDRLRLRGWWRGLGGLWLPLPLPLRVFGVFHGNIAILDVLVSPVLNWFAVDTVSRVDQSLPLCGQEASQTPRHVTKCHTVALCLTGAQPWNVSRTPFRRPVSLRNGPRTLDSI